MGVHTRDAHVGEITQRIPGQIRCLNFGEQLGLSKDWVVRIIRQVGNYGEVFDRNVGAGSKLGISRGLNRLWTKGGIQYAPPVR